VAAYRHVQTLVVGEKDNIQVLIQLVLLPPRDETRARRSVTGYMYEEIMYTTLSNEFSNSRDMVINDIEDQTSIYYGLEHGLAKSYSIWLGSSPCWLDSRVLRYVLRTCALEYMVHIE